MFAEYNVYSQLPALIAGQFIMKLHIMLCQFFNLRTDYLYRRCDKAVIRRLGAYPCLHTGSILPHQRGGSQYLRFE